TLRSGIVLGVAGLVVLLLAVHVWRVDDGQTQRTYLLTTLVLLGLDVLLRVLADSSKDASLDQSLHWLVAAAVPVYLLAMYVPLFAFFFELTPLTLMQWTQILGIVAPAVALARASDRFADSSFRGALLRA